jgi:hypothetical protein
MKKTTAILWTCPLLPVIGVQATKTTKATAASSGVTKALIQQILDAWSTMDTNKITPFYSHAPRTSFSISLPCNMRDGPNGQKVLKACLPIIGASGFV